MLRAGIPYFGICFGNQILGRALGFGTYKLKYGHRGINQPVMDRTTGKVEVTAHNHGFAPMDYVNGVPADRVRQIHLAGHSYNGTLIVDTHDHPVPDPVWTLYADTIKRLGRVSTMIERDDDIPALSVLLAELDQAREIARCALEERAA